MWKKYIVLGLFILVSIVLGLSNSDSESYVMFMVFVVPAIGLVVAAAFGINDFLIRRKTDGSRPGIMILVVILLLLLAWFVKGIFGL